MSRPNPSYPPQPHPGYTQNLSPLFPAPPTLYPPTHYNPPQNQIYYPPSNIFPQPAYTSGPYHPIAPNQPYPSVHSVNTVGGYPTQYQNNLVPMRPPNQQYHINQQYQNNYPINNNVNNNNFNNNNFNNNFNNNNNHTHQENPSVVKVKPLPVPPPKQEKVPAQPVYPYYNNGFPSQISFVSSLNHSISKELSFVDKTSQQNQSPYPSQSQTNNNNNNNNGPSSFDSAFSYPSLFPSAPSFISTSPTSAQPSSSGNSNFAILQLSNGYYRGQVNEKGELHGRGIMVFTDGSRYEGQWSDGKQNGQGELVEVDDSIYRGNFHQGLKSGAGTQEWPNGEFYEGQWRQNLRDGWGTLKSTGSKAKNFFYDGQWKYDMMDGTGMTINPMNATWSIQIWHQGRLKLEKPVQEIRRSSTNPIWESIAGGDLIAFRQVVELNLEDIEALLKPEPSPNPPTALSPQQLFANTKTHPIPSSISSPSFPTPNQQTTTTPSSLNMPPLPPKPSVQKSNTIGPMTTPTTAESSNQLSQVLQGPPPTQPFPLSDSEIEYFFKTLDSVPLPTSSELKSKHNANASSFIASIESLLDTIIKKSVDIHLLYRRRMQHAQDLLPASACGKQKQVFLAVQNHSKNPQSTTKSSEMVHYLNSHSVDPDSALIGLVPSQKIISQLSSEIDRLGGPSFVLSNAVNFQKGDLVIVSLILPPYDPLSIASQTSKSSLSSSSLSSSCNSSRIQKDVDQRGSLENDAKNFSQSFQKNPMEYSANHARTAVLRAISGAKEKKRRRNKLAVPFAPRWVFARTTGTTFPQQGLVEVYTADEKRRVQIPAQNVIPLQCPQTGLYPWISERIPYARSMESLVHQPIQVLYDRLSEEVKEATREFLEAIGLDTDLLTRANENAVSIVHLRDLRKYSRTLSDLVEWTQAACQKKTDPSVKIDCSIDLNLTTSSKPGSYDKSSHIKALQDFLQEMDDYAAEQIKKFLGTKDVELIEEDEDDLEIFQQKFRANPTKLPELQTDTRKKDKNPSKIHDRIHQKFHALRDKVGSSNTGSNPNSSATSSPSITNPFRRRSSSTTLLPTNANNNNPNQNFIPLELEEGSDEQEVTEEEERAHYLRLRRYRFEPTWQNALAQLQSFSFGGLVISRIKRYHQISETALETAQVEGQREFASGKKKSDLSQTWLREIRSAVDSFLVNAGYRPDAVPPNYTDQAPDNLAYVRTNLALLNDVLDPEQDHKTGARAMMIDVASRIYPLIDDFIASCLVYLGDIFNWPGELRPELLDLMDSQRMQMITDGGADCDAEKIYPRWARDMVKDLKYLVRMKELEVDKSIRERDIVPITGLIISCFARHQKEHQTVLELWGHLDKE
eukprot:TRINITY_DN1087_c0_g6_i1.p1 TRINITY_DN1087_c0_g6~~TRINITY_DN1087_c0_g6_i1.p1  ORF type:complete len:1356 (-),score=306.30 TRINITY_DN1087_c0_g6_i1:35-4102(-)